jgi:uncharacterized membrane protein
VGEIPRPEGAYAALNHKGAQATHQLAGAPLFALILLLYFVLPALIAFGVSEAMRRMGWIKPGQMKLDL